jgi:hypothetical protein
MVTQKHYRLPKACHECCPRVSNDGKKQNNNLAVAFTLNSVAGTQEASKIKGRSLTKVLNNVGLKTHPCFTPTVEGNVLLRPFGSLTQ